MSGAAYLGTDISDGVSANGERTFIRGVAQTVEYHGMVKYDVIHRGLPGAEAARPSSFSSKVNYGRIFIRLQSAARQGPISR